MELKLLRATGASERSPLCAQHPWVPANLLLWTGWRSLRKMLPANRSLLGYFSSTFQGPVCSAHSTHKSACLRLELRQRTRMDVLQELFAVRINLIPEM